MVTHSLAVFWMWAGKRTTYQPGGDNIYETYNIITILHIKLETLCNIVEVFGQPTHHHISMTCDQVQSSTSQPNQLKCLWDVDRKRDHILPIRQRSVGKTRNYDSTR